MVAAAISLANLSIPTVNEQLTTLIPCDLAACINRFLLSAVDGSRAAVPFTAHGPSIVVRHDMLVSSSWHLSTLQIVEARSSNETITRLR